MKKFLIVLAVLLAIGGVTWYVIASKKRKTETDALGIDTDNSFVTSEFPLKEGKRGASVIRLQKYLNSVYKTYSIFTFETLQEDGIFGPLTKQMCLALLGVTEVSEELFNSKKM
jgi:peptidoglycan hydrolase-like protein with peptidoglycan-binding domain